MDDQDRESYERDLAVAVLAIWLLFESISAVRAIDFREFGQLFSEHVRPILSRVYGMARNTLANSFGVNYPSRPDGSGGQVISLPNLQAAMDRFQQTLWDSFQKRWTSAQAAPATQPATATSPATSPTGRQSQPTTLPVTPRAATSPTAPDAPDAEPEIEEQEPLYTEADAHRTAITSVTDAASLGEMDAARDVESRAGVRLVPIWRAEPDACDICANFDGKGRSVWGREFPDGPTAHCNCRCSLEWRPLI